MDKKPKPISFKTVQDKKQQIDDILHPLVKEWFYSRFKAYSIPQKLAVSEIHSRHNVLVSAPTGATKTLTAFLSILNELIDLSHKDKLQDQIYAVYISPLKALSNDIEKNLKQPLAEMEKLAGKPLGIRVAVRTGDTTQSKKSVMLRKPPHILITTPESLGILLTSIKFSQHLINTQWCIVDEIHSLAENKRGVQLSLGLERLQQMVGYCTRIGLSATIAPIEDVAGFLVGQQDDEPRPCKIIDVQFIKDLDLKVISPVQDLMTSSYAGLRKKMYTDLNQLIQDHIATLIFTNTRAGTERVVHNLKELFPKNYTDNIGAHHGSLSKLQRLDIESRLRDGKLKCVVTSTSLELGIDIGYIDLVILLGSPKSVARCLQRIGRSGHRLHETAKGRMIVMDRDDLVECCCLQKNAIEKRIDKIHIPSNCLDVLAQEIYGIAICNRTNDRDLYKLVKQSYCYRNLEWKDFTDVLDYLAGRYVSLEDRHIYAKIWYDEETKEIGRKGRMSRVIYMTNIGTIPDESFIEVRDNGVTVGFLDEAFLERLRPKDIFVLGGNVYEFRYSRGMVAYVNSSVSRPPTVPSWFSESLPLSFDLAQSIGRFRRLVSDRLNKNESKDNILLFIQKHLYVDNQTADALFSYIYQQHRFSEVPHDKKLLIEIFDSDNHTIFAFHSMFGRRVNHALSNALGFAISRLQKRDVGLGFNDNGFFVQSSKNVQVLRAFDILKEQTLRKVLTLAIDSSETLSRRFRHCAGRSLMILRNYKGRTKRAGRQQVSSKILLNAVRRIDQDFCILREARREVLEDLMDVDSAQLILDRIKDKKISVTTKNIPMPSPFSINLVTQGVADTLKMEDRMEFLKRMHQKVLAMISLEDGKRAKQ